MLQVQRSPAVHDVVVIGSGAGGGTTVKVLTDLGMNVTLLEAGPMLNPNKDFKEHMWPWEVDHRGVGPNAENYFGKDIYPFGYFLAPNGYWNIPGEPLHGRGRQRFQMVPLPHSGRQNEPLRAHFAAFRGLRFQAVLVRRPWVRLAITYDDMSPYYDKAEEFIGVTGTHEGFRSAPDGKFLPPVPPRVHETLVMQAGKRLNIPVIPSRMAMLTKSIHGRAACHYCGQCGRGCRTASAFTSSQAMIFPAMKTGHAQRSSTTRWRAN